MAKQDFLNGGFYGKIGNVVGQRWKNKRIVREYTIPSDPKTPAQMAHRKKFAHLVELCQAAMRINKGADFWQNPSNTEWALRMKTCSNRIKAGMSDAQAMPIYPDNYIPHDIITDLSSSIIEENLIFNISSTSYNMLNTRKFTFTLHVYNSSSQEYIDISYDTHCYADRPLSLILTNTGAHTFNDDCWIAGATSDDADFGGSSIEIPKMPIFFAKTSKLITTPTVQTFDYTNDTFSIRIQGFGASSLETNVTAQLTYFDMSTKQWTTIQSVDNKPQKTMTIKFIIGTSASFPNGSYIDYAYNTRAQTRATLLEQFDISSLGATK